MKRNVIAVFCLLLLSVFFLTSLAFAKYPEYPEILTNKYWQKNKGKISKMQGKTGMGDQLNKVEALFKKIDFQQKFDAMNTLTKTREYLDSFEDNAKAYWNEAVKPCYDELLVLSRLSDNLAAKWKKKKTVPKKARELVESIGDAALKLRVELKSVDNTIIKPSMKDLAAYLERTESKAREMLDMWITSVKKGVKEVRDSPTKETYENKLHQKVRGIATAINRIPEHQKKWGQIWNKMAADSYVRSVKNLEEAALLKKVDKIEDTLKKFESSL